MPSPFFSFFTQGLPHPLKGGNGGIWEGRREGNRRLELFLEEAVILPPSPSFFRSAEEPPSFSGQQNLLPEREGKGKKDYRLVGEAQALPSSLKVG